MFVCSLTGLDYKICDVEIEGKKIKLQIWDLGGRERFRTQILPFFRAGMVREKKREGREGGRERERERERYRDTCTTLPGFTDSL